MNAESLLALAGDLERRDEALGVELERIAELAHRAETVGERAIALAALLARLPAELAAADRAHAEELDRRREAETDVANAAQRLARLEADGRAGEDARQQARHALSRAREALADADARADEIRRRRALLRTDGRAGRVEARALAAEAERIATALASISRVSESGRGRPGTGLPGLVAWGSRVHAALLVVRSQLEVERDRIVREANELGSAVLGEQLGGQRVALVGRRVRAVLER